MRSSKQRSRNKQNRNIRPTGGNIVNRVFDSSGPDGKVRGTPAQIIEKYAQLHRDAQLAGDRVNAENFAQHAEHYTRMLAEAQREIDRAREEQEQFARDRQAERDRQFEASREAGRDGNRDPGRDVNRDRERDRERERAARLRAQEEAQNGLSAPDASFLSQPLFPILVAEPEDDMGMDAGLVETPEERASAAGRNEPAAFRRERPRREGPRREDGAPQARDQGRARDQAPDRDQVPDQDRDRDQRQPEVAAAPPAAALMPDRQDGVTAAPADSQATPGEDGARPGIAVAGEESAAPKPRRPRRPRQPRVEAAEPAPDAAE